MKIIISCLVASLVFLGGCAATVTEAGYYWGDYSQTLYKYTLDPNEDTLAEHTEELNNIIDKSREFGYIRARQGDNAQATAYYETEMSLYPESRLFLERLTATTTKGSN
jgi:hypothetical protein